MSRTARVHFDEDALVWLSELPARISGFADLVEKPINIVQLIRDLPQAAAAFCFERLGTGRTSENRIVLKPSNGMLRLMAALRALDRHSHRIRKVRA
jgi:hypothetical protein